MDDLCSRLATDLDGAFPEVVNRLQDEIYSGLRSLAGAEAEDLAQETFIRAYRALHGYEADRIRQLRLRGWVWTIALNLGRNHARDRARRPLLLGLEDDLGANDPEPPDLDAWHRRLGTLPPAMRKAVVLRHVVGMSYDDISATLDRPEGTVKADIHRALDRLRKVMESEE